MADYRLTPRALADLDAIADYSLDRWGRERTEAYLHALVARMRWLAESPGLGSPRNDIAPGYRSYPEGSHLIFYIEDGDHIAIIGVLHASMDAASQFRL